MVMLELTRRGALKLAGGTIAGSHRRRRRDDSADDVLVHVGYETRARHRSLKRLGKQTIHDFAFDALTLRLSGREVERIANFNDIRYVEPIRPVYAHESTLNYGVDRVDADIAHDHDETGEGAHIAVVDTGIDNGHDRLKPNIGEGKAIVRAGWFHLTPWDDDHGHGSHCAGILGATNPEGGVTSESTIHSVKVLNANGKGNTDDVAKGIEHVAKQGWDVANLSFGTEKSNLLADAVKFADERGVLLVASAGHEEEGYPAREEEVLAVGATDADDEVADFSPTDGSIDLLAPGVDIRSTVPNGFDQRSGTSMASAHVSGVAGLVMAEGRTATEARDRLLNTAEDLDYPEDKQGAGLVDAARATGHDSAPDLRTD